MNKKEFETKCYNSWSCILSCAIILFVILSITYDMAFTKPRMHKDIKEIRENVRQLNNKFDTLSAQQNIIRYIDIVDTVNLKNDKKIEDK
ncbi:MAG: hypothetical protein [Wendovervirus sonii]|uniref:Uncharacterized protein n=1 Tax=phage Lak_Megaphage_Sonny TaxID=3109229 RepID=A0ABZ0Z480_9CAUD|nr:MAG: hypothetical protein [phage Lak_Megaphage_Sonny]